MKQEAHASRTPDAGCRTPEIFRDNPPGVREALLHSTIGIAGAGGIGSNVSMLLARAGAGRLIIVDHDRIEPGNLNRQAYFLDQTGMFKVDALAANIARIGAGTDLVVTRRKLEPGSFCELFYGCDVLVEALDDEETKVTAVGEWLVGFPDTPIVAVSGIAGTGREGVIRPEHRGLITLVGDQSSPLSLGIVSSRVALAASMVADEVISILTERRTVVGIRRPAPRSAKRSESEATDGS